MRKLLAFICVLTMVFSVTAALDLPASADEGSLIFTAEKDATLSSAYVSTLADGNHELKITVSDGEGAASFITPYEVTEEQADYTVWIIIGCTVFIVGAILTAALLVKRNKKV